MKTARFKIMFANYPTRRGNADIRIPTDAIRKLSIQKGDFFHWGLNQTKSRILTELSIVKTPTSSVVQERRSATRVGWIIEVPAFYRRQLLQQRKSEYYIKWRWTDTDIWGEILIDKWVDILSPNPNAVRKALQDIDALHTLPARKQR